MPYYQTDEFVGNKRIKTVFDIDKLPSKMQYMAVNAIVNGGNLIVVTPRQTGLTAATHIAMDFLNKVVKQRVLLITRDKSIRDMGRENSSTRNGCHGLEIVHERELPDVDGYDVVIFEDFSHLKCQSLISSLRQDGKVRVVLVESKDKRSALSKISTYGGHFNVVALVDYPKQWDKIESSLSAPDSETDFINQWSGSGDNA